MPGRFARSIAWPPSSTWSPLPDAARATLTTFFTPVSGRSIACRSKVTVAYAMWPSREICDEPAAAYGDRIAAT